MSHVAIIEDIEIKDLADLRQAVADLGMEWREGQTEYEWFGRHVGDYPIPEGFSEHDLGKCEHAIAMNDADRFDLIQRTGKAYEVGVVKRRDGKPGWQLLWDFFAQENGLMKRIGPNGNLLRQAIANATAIRTMRAQGYRLAKRDVLANGTVKLQFAR